MSPALHIALDISMYCTETRQGWEPIKVELNRMAVLCNVLIFFPSFLFYFSCLLFRQELAAVITKEG